MSGIKRCAPFLLLVFMRSVLVNVLSVAYLSNIYDPYGIVYRIYDPVIAYTDPP